MVFKTLSTCASIHQAKVNESAVRDFNAELPHRTLRDFRAVLCSVNSVRTVGSPALRFEGYNGRPRRFNVQIFELGEFSPSSQNRQEWLPLVGANPPPARIPCDVVH